MPPSVSSDGLGIRFPFTELELEEETLELLLDELVLGLVFGVGFLVE